MSNKLQWPDGTDSISGRSSCGLYSMFGKNMSETDVDWSHNSNGRMPHGSVNRE